MQSQRSLSLQLLAGLAITLSAALIYSFLTENQIRTLKQFQAETMDRNRVDSLLLLRIQNALNSLDLALRDMLDPSEPYPLWAWSSQLERIRGDLDDAVAREARYAPADRTADQTRYLQSSLAQFWDSSSRIMQLAKSDEKEARLQIRLSLQARQSALSTAVARLLAANNQQQERAALTTQAIYTRVERNLYVFLAALLITIVGTGAYLIYSNQKLLRRMTGLAQERSELARQLIATQESTYRSISRDLHDDLGQVLTAIGLMLQRIRKRTAPELAPVQEDLRAVQLEVQSTLDKVRSLSQALHPVMLEEMGFEEALHTYLPSFRTRTGIDVEYQRLGPAKRIDRELAIHAYRVLQEALNNVARHSQCKHAKVRLALSEASLILEVEDDGIGIRPGGRPGLGLVSMRERAGIVKGVVEVAGGPEGGTLVRFTAPLSTEEVHV